MKRKRLLISGLVLAALLAIAPGAQAGGWVGLRFGHPHPRREVVVRYPGRVWVAGYRGWNYGRYDWLPGRWMARRPGAIWGNRRWGHIPGGRVYRGQYWHRR